MSQRAPMMPGAIDGIVLLPLELAVEAEQNVAGVVATVIDKKTQVEQQAILWGFTRGPWGVEVGGERRGGGKRDRGIKNIRSAEYKGVKRVLSDEMG